MFMARFHCLVVTFKALLFKQYCNPLPQHALATWLFVGGLWLLLLGVTIVESRLCWLWPFSGAAGLRRVRSVFVMGW